MEKLSNIEESLPSLILYMPEKLLDSDPVGDKEKFRSCYVEISRMGNRLDLNKLKSIKEELANNNVTFTEHKNIINNIQDWWFGTRRVDGDTYLILLYGLVSAYVHTLTDLKLQAHKLNSYKLSVIYYGLPEMAKVYYEYLYKEELDYGKDAISGKNNTEIQQPDKIPHPMYRWRSGHQLFFNTIQTLNILFKMTGDAVSDKKWSDANKYISKSAFFMNMSARSIEYASNFSSEQYHRQVRTLMPPGFSGLMLADHTLMINLLKNLRESIFSNPPEQIRESVSEFLASMEECYNSHNLICESFVNDGPSLRDINSDKFDPPPAIESLEKLKIKRLKMLSKNKK